MAARRILAHVRSLSVALEHCVELSLELRLERVTRREEIVAAVGAFFECKRNVRFLNVKIIRRCVVFIAQLFASLTSALSGDRIMCEFLQRGQTNWKPS